MIRSEIRSISLFVGVCCFTAIPSLNVSGWPETQEPVHGGEAHGEHAQDKHGHAHGAHSHKEQSHRDAGHGNPSHGDPNAEGLNRPGFHHDFSDAARWAKRFDAPERPSWQKPESLLSLMAIEEGMVVADIGAGTGFFAGYLSTAVGSEGRVLALDVEETLVSHITDRAKQAGWSNVEARRIPYDGPGLEPASVDRILIVNTWHHIDARKTYSSKLLRALRPGGAIFVVDYTEDSEHGPPKAHRLAPERVIAELESGGLEAEVLPEDLPRQYVVAARLPNP